jgi:hypothetical protein
MKLKSIGKEFIAWNGKNLVNERDNQMFDFKAEDLIVRTKDIQLLRVTKQMQEFIRSGDEHRNGQEITMLEKNAEYSERVTPNN